MHYIKDVILGEDARPIRRDHVPRVMALLRDSVLNLTRLSGNHSDSTVQRCRTINISAR